MMTYDSFLNKSSALWILSFFFCFSHNAIAQNVFVSAKTSALNIETALCLVNSTAADISISDVWSIDRADWQGELTPSTLLNKTVMPFSASCWPLTLVRRAFSYNQFNMKIHTNLGAMSWTVKQYDAIGEIHKNHETLTNDTPYYLLQKAGDDNGYATNVFVLEDDVKTQDDELSRWMKRIPDQDTLKNIQLIGTHDSGVNLQDGVSCDVPSALAAAQAWGLAAQLNHGVRYFDIRLETGKGGDHYPYHKRLTLGCSSHKSFEQSLHEMINFIKLHPSETIILKISHTSSSVESVIKMLDALTNASDLGQYFYKSNIDTYHLTDKTIGELRGKLLLLLDCEYSDFLSPQKGYFSFSTSNKNTCSPDDETKVIYDQYSNTKDFDKMYHDQLNKLAQHGKDKDQLFLLSWTLTGGDIVAHTPRPAAYLARLSKETFGKSLPIPNIVYYDFEDPGINKILVANGTSRYIISKNRHI